MIPDGVIVVVVVVVVMVDVVNIAITPKEERKRLSSLVIYNRHR